MNVTIVDYKSGNISSVINSFKEVAQNKVKIEVTSDVSKIESSDKVIDIYKQVYQVEGLIAM